jgi:tetratricopeptide (TPR) repeat protein/predicted Ser/Thr protein kinase
MGEVFKAWDPELERWVALKYLRHDDPVLVERLLREARAQARVDHPSVCKVYEVGEDDGRPYIAMEFVAGEPLDVAARELSLEHKVLLVRRVAEAVQAAHAVGLVHRDLKPANILVADRDGLPHPWVLDFGIARIEEAAGLTVTGQVVGTPGYLSPEQARGDTGAIDRRTDVFSLGVILYELLGGARPFTGDSDVQVLVNLIENEPEPLRRRAPGVPRDLETVVMTCLEKDPDRRYPSARALADDLGRFLDGEPVEARPLGLRQRLLRKARKNPLTTAALSVAALALVTLAVVAVGGWVKYTTDLKRERDLAEAREAEAKEIADFMVGVFEISDPDRSHGEEVTARELLDRGAERILSELGDRPATQARLLGIMGEVTARLGLYDRALPLLENALDRVLALPNHSAETEIEARTRLADLCVHLADLERGAEVAGPIRELVATTPALDPGHAVQGLSSCARIALNRGDLAEAEAILTEALDLGERELGPSSPLVGDLLNEMCVLMEEQGRSMDALPVCRRALAAREAAYGPDHPRVATTLNNLGNALQGAGQLDEAAAVGERVLEMRRRLLGAEHPRVASALNNLGLTYKKMGDLDRAEALYRESLELRRKVYGDDHPRVATALANLAGVDRDRGDLDLAEARYREAIAIYERALGPDHPDLTSALGGLAQVAALGGRHGEAEAIASRALAIREAAYGADSPNLVGPLTVIGEARLAQGRLSEARASLERARRLAVAASGEASEAVAELDATLSEVERLLTGSPAAQP